MRSCGKFNRGLVRQYHKWMIANHYAKSTQAVYHAALRRYLAFFGERSIASAKHTDIRLFLADASENGATLVTVYRDLGILRQFYDFLNLGGVVSFVAPRFVRLRVPFHNRLNTLSHMQIRRLIAAAQTPRELATIEFYYSTGCRLSEGLHLKIEHVDFTARQARVRGKLGKTRLVLLAESAVKSLRTYLGDRKKGYVFEPEYWDGGGHFRLDGNKWRSTWNCTRRSDGKRIQRVEVIGESHRMTLEEARIKHDALMKKVDRSFPRRSRPLTKMAIQLSIRKIARRAGLKNVTCHTLRRTFATHLHESGAGLEVIRILLGHVWIQTTMRYARIGPDGLSKSYEKCHPMGNRYETPQE
jgi:integrase/recombinase XerC